MTPYVKRPVKRRVKKWLRVNFGKFALVIFFSALVLWVLLYMIWNHAEFGI